MKIGIPDRTAPNPIIRWATHAQAPVDQALQGHADGALLETRRAWIDPRATEFLDALSSAITEFAATDKRKDEEKELFDAYGREFSVFGHPACMFEAFVPTIINGYVVLNLLVQDEERLRPVVFRPNRDWLWENGGCRDGRHPEWMVKKFEPIVDSNQPDRCWPKPLNQDVIAQIREYCGELFKCMYTRPDIFTRENLERYLWLERHMRVKVKK